MAFAAARTRKENEKKENEGLAKQKQKKRERFENSPAGKELRRKQEEEHLKFEENRLQIFQSHIDLISISGDLNQQELNEQINSLKELINPSKPYINEEIGLPKIKEKNLFNVVLESKLLNNQEKSDLLECLLSKGYNFFYPVLLQNPLVDILLENAEFNFLLKTLYFVHLHRCDYKLEKLIWDSLLRFQTNGADLLNKLLTDEHQPEAERLLQFIEHWLSTIHNKVEIITAHQEIEKLTHNTELETYAAFIKKIAQLRIVTIEFNSIKEEKYPLSQSKEQNSDSEKRINNFLSSTETRFFRLCQSHPSSNDVYKRLRLKKLEATDEYNEKIERAQRNINARLSEDAEYPTYFTFKK